MIGQAIEALGAIAALILVAGAMLCICQALIIKIGNVGED